MKLQLQFSLKDSNRGERASERNQTENQVDQRTTKVWDRFNVFLEMGGRCSTGLGMSCRLGLALKGARELQISPGGL